MKQKFAKIHTLVNDAFAKVGQTIWGAEYLITVYEQAFRLETSDDVTDVEFVDMSDKVDLPGDSSIDWN